jgi:long-subunit fatty acid transport protein
MKNLSNMKHITVNLLLLIFVFGFQNSLIAGDPDFRSVSRARTLSLNGMYIAGCDGTNNLFNNAAALSYVDSKEIEFSLVDRIGQSQLNNPSNGLYKSYQVDEVPLSAGIIYPILDNLVVSVSYQRIYDYSIQWPYAMLTSTDSSSYLQTFDLDNSISVDAILPGIAYRFGEISIGATFNVFNVNYKSSFPISNSTWGDTLGLPAYQMNYNLNAWSFGFNLGLMFDVMEELRIGAFVRSSFSTELEGDATSDLFSEIDSISSQSSVTTIYEYPWVIGLGLLYKTSPNLFINLDFQYSLFSNTRESLDMSFSDPGWEDKSFGVDPLTGIDPSNILLAFEDAIDAGIGIEYIPNDWSFRCGYRFSQSQNSLASYNFLFPTVDKNWISLGLGYNDSVYFIDLTAAYAFGVATEVNTYPFISGSYDSETVDVGITLRYIFEK